MAEKYTIKELKQILKDVGGYRALKVKAKGYTRKQDLFDLLNQRNLLSPTTKALQSGTADTSKDLTGKSEGKSDEATIRELSPSIYESVKGRIKDAPDVRVFPVSKDFQGVWNPWRQLRIEYELLMVGSSEWTSLELKLLYYLNNPDDPLEHGLLATLYPLYPLLCYFFILDYEEMRKAAYIDNLVAPFSISSGLSSNNPFKIAYMKTEPDLYDSLKYKFHKVSLPILHYLTLGTSVVSDADIVVSMAKILKLNVSLTFLYYLLKGIVEYETLSQDTKQEAIRKIIDWVKEASNLKYLFNRHSPSPSVLLTVINQYPDMVFPDVREIPIDSNTTDLLDTEKIDYNDLAISSTSSIKALEDVSKWIKKNKGVKEQKAFLVTIVNATKRLDVIAYIGIHQKLAHYEDITPMDIAKNREKNTLKNLLSIIETEKKHAPALLAIINLMAGYPPEEADKACKVIAEITEKASLKPKERIISEIDQPLASGAKDMALHLKLFLTVLNSLFKHHKVYNKIRELRDDLIYEYMDYVYKYIDVITPDTIIKSQISLVNIGNRRNPLIAKLWEHKKWGIGRLLEYYIQEGLTDGVLYSLEHGVNIQDIDPLMMVNASVGIREAILYFSTK